MISFWWRKINFSCKTLGPRLYTMAWRESRKMRENFWQDYIAAYDQGYLEVKPNWEVREKKAPNYSHDGKEKEKRKPTMEMVLWLKSNNWLSLKYLFRLTFLYTQGSTMVWNSITAS